MHPSNPNKPFPGPQSFLGAPSLSSRPPIAPTRVVERVEAPPVADNKTKARSLRLEGLTILQIATQLNCARSVVQRWVSDIQLPAALTITVSKSRRVLLSKALIQHFDLQEGQQIDIVPQPPGTPWLLDLKSRTGSSVILRGDKSGKQDGKGWLTLAHHLGVIHFFKPTGQGKTGVRLPTRTLTLGEQDPDRPGIYFLYPD